MRPAALGSLLSTRVLGVTVGVAALVSLTACGGGSGDSSDGVASLGTGDAVSTETTVAGNDQDKILAYTACLREQGLDVADPTFDADGNMDGGFFGADSGIDPRSEEFQAAQDACGSLIEGVTLGGPGGGGNFDPEAMQQATLAYTECLRDQGLEVDDLDLNAQGGPGGGPGVGGSIPPDASLPAGSLPDGAGQGPGGGDPSNRLAEILGLDPDDPTVAAALEVCAPVLEDAMSSVTSTTVAS